MKCPACNTWARVLETRQEDDGHRVRRRMECANGHRFNTFEVHEAVYCSAKPRQRVFIETLKTRFERRERDREILRRLADGERGSEIAKALGISKSRVSQVARDA